MTLSSLWSSTSDLPSYPRLTQELHADVVVVGGGIAGLTAALLLRRAGKHVVLIEAHRIGAGETGRTTAHITEVLDARYHTIESKFGRDGARRAAASTRAAMERIERLVRELDIRCGYRHVPAFLYAETPEQTRELEEELDALQRSGANAAWTDTVPLPFRIDSCVRIDHQAQFHPLEYLRGLAERFTAEGGRIFEESRVIDVDDGRPARVTTDGGVVHCLDVVVATNVPVSSRFAIHTKIAAYRSYAIAAPIAGELPQGLFWDMQDPYHYIRYQGTRHGTYVIIGGEDHKTGQAHVVDPFARLESWARTHFGSLDVQYRWSGQIIEPSDGLPFIGKNAGSEHVYVATGFSGTGMTFGTLAATIIADAILGVDNEYSDLYDATRVKPIAQVVRYVSENIDYATHLAADRIARGDVDDPQAIPHGQGRLMRKNGRMLAVYRDEHGELSAVSAVCTHLGCHVKFNDNEQSWDCPCHGSRFDTNGDVLNGPAVKGLEQVDVEPIGDIIRPPSRNKP